MPVLYIDATAGGLGLQMLLAAIVGGLVTVKIFWARFLSLFRRGKPDGDEAVAISEAPVEALEKES